MKILVLSDLFWNSESREIKLSQVFKMKTSEILNHSKFSRVKFYFDIVTKNSPDLLLLCGDITGDGSCGHGYTSSIAAFLRLVDAKKTKTRYISGNHDEPQFYNKLKKHFYNYKNVNDVSNKVEEVDGLKLLGLSWEQTKTKASFRKAFTSEQLDIIFCHCEHRRRLKLFDYNASIIITGHYDLKVINPNNKTFISLDNDTIRESNFVTIEGNLKKQKITFSVLSHITGKLIYFKFIKSNKSLSLEETNYEKGNLYNYHNFTNINYLNNIQFEKVIERLQKVKNAGLNPSSKELEEILSVRINQNLKVSRKFISEAIPNFDKTKLNN